MIEIITCHVQGYNKLQSLVSVVVILSLSTNVKCDKKYSLDLQHVCNCVTIALSKHCNIAECINLRVLIVSINSNKICLFQLFSFNGD